MNKLLVDFEHEKHPTSGVPVVYLMFSREDGSAVVEMHTVYSLLQFLSVLNDNSPRLDAHSVDDVIHRIGDLLPMHTNATIPPPIKDQQADERATEIVDRVEERRETERQLDLGVFFIAPPERG